MDNFRITMKADAPDAGRIGPLLERDHPPLPSPADHEAWTAVAERLWTRDFRSGASA